MPLIEQIKERSEKLTGVGRPSRQDLAGLVRPRKANAFYFRDDGTIPNNRELPFVTYRSPIRLDGDFDPAAIFEELFASNGWGDSWRDGIYDYVHYHSRIHEVLGIARGHARVRFGGGRGRIFELNAGDVAILPAGTGHQRLGGSKDLLVVGAYPPFGTYDEFRGSPQEHAQALVTIPRVKLPRKDPVYGTNGPLMQLWSRGGSGRAAS